MSDVITLDFSEAADEWQELLYEQDDIADSRSLRDERGRIAQETYQMLSGEMSKYEELCRELDISPIEPATLRWYGERNTLIREDTFVDYARDFAEDIWGDCARELGSYIDWDKFATSMRQDYYSHTYDGHEWLRRA